MKRIPQLIAAALLGAASLAQAQNIVMASTTSTEQSGLFAHLLPAFTAATGVTVKVVAVGTGQAIDMGRRGDADVLFVHDQVAEEKVVAEGFALKRMPVMYNDFVQSGPAATRRRERVATKPPARRRRPAWAGPAQKPPPRLFAPTSGAPCL